MKRNFSRSIVLGLIKIFLIPTSILLGYKGTPFSYLRKGLNFRLNRGEDLFWLHRDFLKKSGWLESIKFGAPQKNGDPIPWITYPAFHFISDLQLKELAVTEVGSGASSFYFAKHCKSLTTFEDDLNFGKTMLTLQKSFKVNFSLINVSPMSKKSFTVKYDKELPNLNSFLEVDCSQKAVVSNEVIDITKHLDIFIDSIKQADIIFIDGWFRNLSIYLAGHFSKTSAIIIVDNSDAHYTFKGCNYLLDNNFYEIPFRGIGPLNTYEWTTSIFARDLNKINYKARQI